MSAKNIHNLHTVVISFGSHKIYWIVTSTKKARKLLDVTAAGCRLTGWRCPLTGGQVTLTQQWLDVWGVWLRSTRQLWLTSSAVVNTLTGVLSWHLSGNFRSWFVYMKLLIWSSKLYFRTKQKCFPEWGLLFERLSGQQKKSNTALQSMLGPLSCKPGPHW